tara:strand:+ start:223 stop:438 length:216 start_codon:yes stop_codon:yes gene_type:complete
MRLSLRDVLKKEGVRQVEFAREMGVTKAYINQLCNIELYYVIDSTLYGVPDSTRRLSHNVVIEDITKYIKK